MKSVAFSFKARISNPQMALQNLGVWLKVKHQLEMEFPGLEATPFFRQLELYGCKPYWLDEWMDKLLSMRTLDHHPRRLQYKLGAILLHFIWEFWPKIYAGKETNFPALNIISDALDRFFGDKIYVVAFACQSSITKEFSGQIDIYSDHTTVAEFRAYKFWADGWAKNTYAA